MRIRVLQNLWLDGAAHCVGSVIDAAPECTDRLLSLGLVETVSEQEKSQEKSSEKVQEKRRKKG